MMNNSSFFRLSQVLWDDIAKLLWSGLEKSGPLQNILEKKEILYIYIDKRRLIFYYKFKKMLIKQAFIQRDKALGRKGLLFMKNYKFWFATGSQDLYGDECLEKVAQHSRIIVEELNRSGLLPYEVVWKPTLITNEVIRRLFNEANADEECAGVITWMHTFSPAKSWILGLQEYRKPLCHLHTQFNQEIPYDTIDMDFMNLNQSAHGDREYGFIVARMGIPHEVVAGYYKHDDVVAKIRQFASVAKAISYSKSLKVASFGNNMREVAVTDGDRVESQIKYGWECNYYALGDLVDIINQVTEEEIDAKMKEYTDKYTMKTDRIDSVREQAKYEVGLEKFLSTNGIGAFADTFQDLHGLKQLPGIAAQNLMGKGIGFGPEGDYKISALSAVLMKMSEGKEGATGFIEDYTYDLTPGQELELASHMLEVPPAFAATKPEIDVIPLGIGGKEEPARLIFDGVTGDGIQVTMVDMGDHFRIICADIELVKQPKPMPKLPVARIMYRHKPNFQIGTAAWCYAGGAHHSVVSTALTRDDIAMFARLTGTELITIGEDTTEADLQKFFMK